jgi:hypothetical protein
MKKLLTVVKQDSFHYSQHYRGLLRIRMQSIYILLKSIVICPQIIIDFFYSKSGDKSIEEFHLHFLHDFLELTSSNMNCRLQLILNIFKTEEHFNEN